MDIRRLRTYWMGLAKTDRGMFVSEHSSPSPGKKIAYNYFLPCVDSLRQKLTNSSVPNTPGELALRLGAVTPGRQRPFVRCLDENLRHVCRTYFLWVLMEKPALVNGPKKQKRTHADQRPFHQGELARRGKHVPQTVDTTSGHVHEWLKQARKDHLRMPNDDYTVLPWAVKVLVHVAFVTEMEEKLGCTWAGKVDVQSGNDDKIDDSEHEQDDQYRYGNRWLGLTGTMPCDREIASLSWFNKIWRKDHKQVRVRKWMPFAKCDVCFDLRTRADATTDAESKKVLLLDYEKHLEEVFADRETYRRNKQRGITHPSEYLSITIDGADNSDHALPYFHNRTHITTDAWRQRMHVVGAIVHGHGLWAFTCSNHVAQGHNVVIQVILDILADLTNRYTKRNMVWPRTLYLQLDNTTKQNKGRYLCGFLHLLVAWGVFDKAHINFLPVGHTHIDIDQFFGRMSVYLRSHDCMCRRQLQECLELCSGYCTQKGHWPRKNALSSTGIPSPTSASGCTRRA